MTTVVRTRHPLEALSMSNQSERRPKSKRLAAAAVYDEQDGDFLFTRGSKRQKTVSSPASPPSPEPKPVAKAAAKKTQGRPRNGTKRVASSPPPPSNDHELPLRASKRPTRRKLDSSPLVPDKPLVVPKKRLPRRTKSPPVDDIAEEEPEPAPAPASAKRTNGARQASKDDGARKSTRKSTRNSTRKQEAAPEENDSQATPEHVDKSLERDPNAQKIALPFSDTPINARNKDFRKKGAAGAGGGRRSSVGLRGKRASSLIESGHSAIPHREVAASEFFKHIESEGLSEPRRMKQLLTWCGERALSEKPKHGTAGAPAVLGARAIQDALLKDFGSKSEFSDWFSREDEPSAAAAPKRPVVIKPNPINVEHEEKIAALEARIKRLKETRKSWRALQAPLPQVSSLDPEDWDPEKASSPDTSLLDAEEAKMLESLTETSSSFAHLKSTTRTRLQTVQAGVEFRVDHLADSVHKMNFRVVTAGRQADKVLASSSERLKEREEKERAAVGTKALPTMEVLRSLSRILPENGG
ncbi:hypothetical protein J7T55_009364 [Diaporthe amygdali]|uniref:uncharacterized protein n=1 Tax=Phomopsis amygdali TaxID=1214568 RepID=UPI0022FF29A7|nr:uncharacterized protein J7T55_009364 [Diaporthe amygdali]KAJ0107400.1 hypothetical protein J7T55_009364 [Diaporthe amygdali]